MSQMYKYNEHYQAVLRNKMPDPVSFLLYPVQGRCNHSCYYCQIEGCKMSKIIMDTDVIIRLLSEAKDLGCRSFEMCGLDSEPCLHPDIDYIFEVAVGLGYKCGLMTNGSIISDNFAELVANHFDYIRISLDSFDLELSERIRGTKDIRKIMDNIKNMVDRRNSHGSNKCVIGVKASLLPETNSVGHIKQVIEKCDGLGVDKLTFKRAIHSSFEHPNYEYIERLIEEARPLYPNLEITFRNAKMERLRTKCLITPFHVFIDANGDVALCCYHWMKSNHVFGNIHKQALKDIWFGEKHWETLRETKIEECNQYECRAIPINNFCREVIYENRDQLDYFI